MPLWVKYMSMKKLARSDKRPRASDAESLHLQTSRGL